MAKKKGDQLRFCCDFRYLNSVTAKDAYPIPRIHESLSKLGDAKFFTTLDLGSDFWQVPFTKQDRDKTWFACELGLFQWKRMPFGLCNATATFQRLMAHALISVTKKYGNLVMCYVDDVVIATPTLEDHIERLDEVFACMKRSGLKCKPSKCEILKDSIKYLGRMVDRHGIRPDPDAVEAVLTWKSPKTEHQLMSFLGFANYRETILKKNRGMAIGIMLKSKIVRETLKAKGYDLNQVETGEEQIDDDLKMLLEKLADEKPVIQENCKEEPEVTILRKSGIASDGNTSMVTKTDGKEVVQSLVEKIPADLLERTRVRKKRVEFKEEAEYLGLGQESGERSTSTEEGNTEGEKLSGECEMWDGDSEASSDNQDSLCMILAEEKIRHRDRE